MGLLHLPGGAKSASMLERTGCTHIERVAPQLSAGAGYVVQQQSGADPSTRGDPPRARRHAASHGTRATHGPGGAGSDVACAAWPRPFHSPQRASERGRCLRRLTGPMPDRRSQAGGAVRRSPGMTGLLKLTHRPRLRYAVPSAGGEGRGVELSITDPRGRVQDRSWTQTPEASAEGGRHPGRARGAEVLRLVSIEG